MINYWPQATESARQAQTRIYRQNGSAVFGAPSFQQTGLGRAKVLVRFLRRPGTDARALARMADWAKTLKVAPGLKLDLDRRWMMVRQLTRYEQKDAPALFAQLKKIDASDRGQKGRLAIEAIQPSFQVKQKWFEIVTQPKPELSLADARSVLGSLFPSNRSTWRNALKRIPTSI